MVANLDAKKIIGCMIGFAGVLIINLSGNDVSMSFNLMGDGFVFISALAYAFSSVLIKKYSQTENPVMLSGYQFLLGGIIMVAGATAAGGRLTAVSVKGGMLLLYMALISAVAYTLWGILLKYNPVSKVSIFGFTNPVFGVILSALILGEGSAFLPYSRRFLPVLTISPSLTITAPTGTSPSSALCLARSSAVCINLFSVISL